MGNGRSLGRILRCSSVAAPLRGCSLLTRGLPKPCDYVSHRNDVPLRGKQCGQLKSLAAPSAVIYKLTPKLLANETGETPCAFSMVGSAP